MISLSDALAALPLIAILRGIRPDECVAVGDVLIASGFRIIEVPLNSPDPLRSVERLSATFGQVALIGAGTVLAEADVDHVARAGGRLIVSANMDVTVIRATVARGLVSAPGVATPSEGFAALAAGAHLLKLFPGDLVTPAVLKAMRAVFPPATLMVPVGGVSAATMPAYLAAGASGFGIGSSLYKPGDSAELVRTRALSLAAAWRSLSEAIP
ncbi:MAG: 2-dehydro-3-deoxy-6-phosphogalactonate aldolase [Hyphomicrobiales bacterium]|nr:2-dehydro-3-deoxy-6-phosphogalactonate aldolase [Hyphomicrobiales bacterium]